eukprot:UN04678
MLDGDVFLQVGDLKDTFEFDLLEYEPAVGVASHTHTGDDVDIITTYDAMFNAFHRYSLAFALPYETRYEP